MTAQPLKMSRVASSAIQDIVAKVGRIEGQIQAVETQIIEMEERLDNAWSKGLGRKLKSYST